MSTLLGIVIDAFLKHNRLTGDANVRPQTIARLPHLKFLDGGEVTARERTDSERWWISWIQKQSQSVQGSGSGNEAEDIGKAEEDRRWKQLCQGPFYISLSSSNNPHIAMHIKL
jgi:hypothetical protein